MREDLICVYEDKYEGYLTDESKKRGHAESISFPNSGDEVKEVIGFCEKSHCTVTVQGGKTGLVGGAVPEGGHILNTARLNKIREVVQVEGKWCITVEAGITLSELSQYINRSKELREYRWVPSPTETTATIGGIISNNAKGINYYHFGNTSRFVESLSVILNNGELKNVTQEMNGEFRQYFGAKGKLGVVIEATLILTKKPENSWGIAFFFEEEKDSWKFLDDLCANCVQSDEAYVTAMEYFNPAVIRLIENKKEGMTKLKELPDIEEKYQSIVYFEIEGTECGIEELSMLLLEKASTFGGDEEATWALVGEDEMEKMRAFRHAAPEIIGMEVEELRKDDMRIHKLFKDCDCENEWQTFSEMMEYYYEICQTHNFIPYVFGYAGNKSVQVNIVPDSYERFLLGEELITKISEVKANESESLV